MINAREISFNLCAFASSVPTEASQTRASNIIKLFLITHFAPMDDLPPPVILEILRRLEDSADVARCRVVSKNFNALADELRYINLTCTASWYHRSRSALTRAETMPFKTVFKNLVGNSRALESVSVGVADRLGGLAFMYDAEDYCYDLYLTDLRFVKEWLPLVCEELKELKVNDFWFQARWRKTEFLGQHLQKLEVKNAWLSVTGLNPMPMLTSLTLEFVRLDDEDLKVALNGPNSLTIFAPELLKLDLYCIRPSTLVIETPLLSDFYLSLEKADLFKVKEFLHLKTLRLESANLCSLIRSFPCGLSINRLTVDSVKCFGPVDMKLLSLEALFDIFPNMSSLTLRSGAWSETETCFLSRSVQSEVVMKGLKEICAQLVIHDVNVTLSFIFRILDVCSNLLDVAFLIHQEVDPEVARKLISCCSNNCPKILRRLDDSAELARCRLVSKTFNALSHEVRSINLVCTMQRYLKSRSPLEIPRPQSFKALFTNLARNCHVVESISIGVDKLLCELSFEQERYSNNDLHLTDEGFVNQWLPKVKYAWLTVETLNPMPSLTTLTLEYVTLDDENLSMINLCFPCLQVLNFIGVGPLKEPKIHLLRLQTCRWTVSNAANSLTISSPNLVKLELKCVNPRSVVLETPLLSDFCLSIQKANELGVKELVRLKNLSLESANLCSLIDSFPHGPAIKTLKLDSFKCAGSVDKTILSLEVLFHVFPNLSYLRLQGGAWREAETHFLVNGFQRHIQMEGLKEITAQLVIQDVDLTLLFISSVLDKCTNLSAIGLLLHLDVEHNVARNLISGCTALRPSVRWKWGMWKEGTSDTWVSGFL
ncbi:hypothetical protein Tsubulata_008791, partial [Turnera subulata]